MDRADCIVFLANAVSNKRVGEHSTLCSTTGASARGELRSSSSSSCDKIKVTLSQYRLRTVWSYIYPKSCRNHFYSRPIFIARTSGKTDSRPPVKTTYAYAHPTSAKGRLRVPETDGNSESFGDERWSVNATARHEACPFRLCPTAAFCYCYPYSTPYHSPHHTHSPAVFTRPRKLSMSTHFRPHRICAAFKDAPFASCYC